MNAYNKDTGARIVGTSEVVAGIGRIMEGSFLWEGTLLAFTYEGSTDVDWSTQDTEHSSKGERIFIDENGDKVLESNIQVL